MNVTIEIAEEDYLADLAAGCDEDETMTPGRYVFTRGGFLARHPKLKASEKSEPEGTPTTRDATTELPQSTR